MVQIVSDISNELLNEIKEQLSDGVDYSEDKQVEALFEVYQGGEEVIQVSIGFLDVVMVDIVFVIFFYVALAGFFVFCQQASAVCGNGDVIAGLFGNFFRVFGSDFNFYILVYSIFRIVSYSWEMWSLKKIRLVKWIVLIYRIIRF